MNRFVCFAAAGVSALALTSHAYADTSSPWPYLQDIPDVESARAAQAKAGKQAEMVQFYSVSKAVDAALSPDGTTLAYIADTSGVPQIWTVPASGGQPQQRTNAGTVRRFYWTPDGKGMVYFADLDGDELPAITYLSADAKTQRTLVRRGTAFAIFGAFASDSSQLMYSTTQRNGEDYDLHLLDVKTGKSQEVYRGKYEWLAKAWQPDGDYVVVTETRGEDAHDVYLFNVKTKTMITLYTPKIAAEFDQMQWRSDGRGFYMTTNLGREFKSLAYYDLTTGELTQLETPSADIDKVSIGDGDQFIAWVVNEDGYSKLRARNLFTNTPLALPDLPAGVYDIQIARDAPVMQITITSSQIPSDIWTYNFETKQLVRATNLGVAGLDLSQMVGPEAVSFKARDGVNLYGLFYAPRKSALKGGGKPPVILSLHGGPTEQAMPGFDRMTQYLAARGYAILHLNYRGSLGFGKTFARLNDKRKRTGEVRDIKDAMDWLKKSGRVDTQRAAVFGISYGGYLATAVLADDPDLFTAGVSMAGVSDWVRALEQASPSLKASDLLEYGDISDPDDRAFFAAISPLAKAGEIKTPMLVVHGANDQRDPVSQSDDLVKKVRAAGGQVDYIRLKDEGHLIQKLDNRVYTYGRISAFFDEQLMPSQEPATQSTPQSAAQSAAEPKTQNGAEVVPEVGKQTQTKKNTAAEPSAVANAAANTDPAVAIAAAAKKAADQDALADQLEGLQAQALALQAQREEEKKAAAAQKALELAQAKAAQVKAKADAAAAALETQQALVDAASQEVEAAEKLLNRANVAIAKAQAQGIEAKEALAKAQAQIGASETALKAAQTQKQQAEAQRDIALAAKVTQAETAAALKSKAEKAQDAVKAAETEVEALSGTPADTDAIQKGFLEKASDVVKSVVDKMTGEAP